MKNLVRMLVLVVLAVAVISTNVVGQHRSKAYLGDKDSREITKSQKNFKSLVADLKKEKSALEKSRDKMLKNPAYYEVAIVKTDSLIGLYQQKIMMLEDKMITFAITASGKDQEDRIELKSCDVNALADAWISVKYAENMSANANGNANSGKQLIGMVENTTYDNPVVVTITGPARFYREFTLGSRGKSPEFELPVIGRYTVNFVSPRGRACITKSAGPNTVYYDGTKQLDFKASFIY